MKIAAKIDTNDIDTNHIALVRYLLAQDFNAEVVDDADTTYSVQAKIYEGNHYFLLQNLETRQYRVLSFDQGVDVFSQVNCVLLDETHDSIAAAMEHVVERMVIDREND
ncbi:hypothetical protein [Dyella telluris]|uniref:Uncharacterized protein n=1 Tax=Dyella telluris TaxID=2763498 RepID=A0A7G8Q4I4_9GAMM|nr:hypothetical protein [Dyella telluris]QNK01692.1 hypothetical protein H8F01_00485 [Dyella telluris]